MLLSPAEKPPADAAWLYQVKWDGVRNLTLVEGESVRHWSRQLRERTRHFPEFAGLGPLFGGKRAVLDGEIVVLRDGKPSFSGILERDLAGGVPDARKIRNTPATLMLFDLLEYGEQELYGRPLAERLDLLGRLVPPEASWQVVATFPGSSGPDLFEAVVREGLEGVVAKRADSPYQPGVRSRSWLKCKRREQMLAVVCGYTDPAGRAGGLLLGAYQAGRLRYIGRVGSGIKADELATIKAHLPPAACPFERVPNLRDRFAGAPGPVVWTEPRLTVLVAFTEWTEELRLRDPVLAGFSREPPEAARMQ